MMDNDAGKRSRADLENYVLYFEGVPANKLMMPEIIDECKRGLGTPGMFIITYGVETLTDSAMVMAISIGDERAGVLIGYGDRYDISCRGHRVSFKYHKIGKYSAPFTR